MKSAPDTAIDIGEMGLAAQGKRCEPRTDVEHTTATIDGEAYHLQNWSNHGFLVTGYTGDHEEGSTVHVGFRVPFVGMVINLGGEARVVRVDKEKGELAGSVLDREHEWQVQTVAEYKPEDWEGDGEPAGTA